MASEFPQSKQEAQDHIRDIRRAKGLGDGPGVVGTNASDLEAALKVLSHDLYQTATHFLLELIQNADDNDYGNASTPTLAISYSSGQLRIDCNERGFSRKNVEAICRIGQSTKSGLNKNAGFVGEKGIGFKAVFKVASVVSIVSGHYHFKFERDGMLGMIAPIWETFPAPVRPGFTSILLKLAGDCDQAALVRELLSYDSRILIFLRRLRQLEVSINGSKTILSRQDRPKKKPAMMTLQKDGTKSHFLVWHHEVSNMPKEERRPNISTSEIILAFPLDETQDAPVLVKQNVYAFLPVRDYGFQFLVQGDFLLPANREDVKPDSAWNRALVLAAATGFVDAVRHMTSLRTKLRYTWVRYIPTQRSQSTIFEEFRQSILSRLRATPVLHSHKGTLEAPQRLIQVPNRFCDHQNRPFMANSSNSLTFLADDYVDADTPHLKEIGVVEMDDGLFFQSMAAALNPAPRAFYKNQSKEWHAAFCRALIPLANSPGIANLAAIPLRDNEWRKSTEGPIFFPHSIAKSLVGATAIPEGIQIQVVDSDAAKDSDRRKLMTLLGVKEFANEDVAAIIIGTHQGRNFVASSLKPKVLLSHAVFLFKARWENTKNEDLWFAAEKGPCRKGSEMYLPSDVPGAMSSYLSPKESFSSFGFVDSIYKNPDGVDQKQWCDWLQKQLNVSVHPRLVRSDFKTNTSATYGAQLIHADFSHLVQQLPSAKWLKLLRDAWSFYSEFLDVDKALPAQKATVEKLNLYLRTFVVRCTGRATGAPLGETFLPIPQLMKDADGMVAFLDIPEPNDARWQHLAALGVGEKDGLQFYLNCLKHYKARKAIDFDQVQHLVNQIEMKAQDDLELLRTTFATQQLIYIPPWNEGARGVWTTSKNCIWKGEPWFVQSVSLDRFYGNNKLLFRIYLRIENAGIDHIIKEAQLVRQHHHTEYIAKIFTAFNIILYVANRELTTEQKNQIRNLRMFPIARTSANDPYERLASVTESSSVDWYIADREDFRAQFDNLLPVLALTVDDVLASRRFLAELGLRDRFLSEVAGSITETQGSVSLNQMVTDKYRNRADFFFRLIPIENFDQARLRVQFRNVEVFTATKVLQSWKVTFQGREVRSSKAECVAFLNGEDEKSLKMYLRSGYEHEGSPAELAEQLRAFFDIAPEHRDLISVVLTASVTRIKELFRARGIPPLLGDDGLPLREPDEEPQLELRDPAAEQSQLRDQVDGTTTQTATGLTNVGTTSDAYRAAWADHRRMGHYTNSSGAAGYHMGYGSHGVAYGNGSGVSYIWDGTVVDDGTFYIAGEPRMIRLLRLVSHQSSSLGSDYGAYFLAEPGLASSGTAWGAFSDTGAAGRRGFVLADAPNVPPALSIPRIEEIVAELGCFAARSAAPPQLAASNAILDKVKGLRRNDIASHGEKLMCHILQRILGRECLPNRLDHPSKRGFKLDLKSVFDNSSSNPSDLAPADFSFADSSGIFTRFLMHVNGIKNYQFPGSSQAVTYHIDVRATEEGRDHPFEMSQGELNRARQHSIHTLLQNASHRRQMTILVRIFNIRRNPHFLFIADPWDLFYDGQLLLENPTDYRATLRLRVTSETKASSSQHKKATSYGPRKHRAPSPPPKEPMLKEFIDDRPLVELKAESIGGLEEERTPADGKVGVQDPRTAWR